MAKEKIKIEKTPEQKRLEELEQRPEPQEGEGLDLWLKRIGGPDATIVENLEKYPLPKEKAKIPLIIDNEASFLLNNKNLDTYFDRKKLEAELKKENPSIHFDDRRGEYQLKKELFQKPELYFHVLGEELKNKRKIVAEKGFGEGIEKWAKELKGEKVEEKMEEKEEKPKKEKAKKKSQPKAGPPRAEKEPEKEKKPEPEKEKKEPTLDEQIAAKQKELEEVERKYNIYYSPVVQDLLGLYYDKRLKDLRKEMKELGKEKKKKKPSSAKAAEGKEPKEMHEKSPTAKEYLTHIKGTDKLFNEMAKTRFEAKKKKGKETRLKYEKAKKEWQDAYKKTLTMEGLLSPKTLEKITKILEKERAKAKKVGLLRKIWSFFKLVAKKFGKEVIEEVKHDVLEKQLETVKQRIKQGGVLGRATLEKEQKRLEKRLKKLKKK